MTQLNLLIWLKWKLFSNSVRSGKAKANWAASTLGSLTAFLLSLIIAAGLGLFSYGLTADAGAGSASLMLFAMMLIIYLMWATLPLNFGGANLFDAGRLLLYPISLRKLFALDLLSEATSFASLLAAPSVASVVLGAWLGNTLGRPQAGGRGHIGIALSVAFCAILFGIALTKLLSTFIASLMERKRTGGESIIALIGAVGAIISALAGHLVPLLMKREAQQQLPILRWTPPGAVAAALTFQPDGAFAISSVTTVSIATLISYTLLSIALTYCLAQRAAMNGGGSGGGGGDSHRAATSLPNRAARHKAHSGWQVPLLSGQLSTVFEKELRYLWRNSQLRVMIVMPLIFSLPLKLTTRPSADDQVVNLTSGFAAYTEGSLAAFGVLYAFMFIASVWSNLFGYDGAGMRSLILAPVDRQVILCGKNLAVTLVAFVAAASVAIVNAVIFRDQSLQALAFALLYFITVAPIFALFGNWLSISSPKRLQFGKRMNVAGITGWLLIPIFTLAAIPPVCAVLISSFLQSIFIKYVILAVFAAVAGALYVVLITKQGRALEEHQLEILEAVTGRQSNG